MGLRDTAVKITHITNLEFGCILIFKDATYPNSCHIFEFLGYSVSGVELKQVGYDESKFFPPDFVIEKMLLVE